MAGDELKIREISPELLEHAKKELGEEPRRRAEDIRALRDWLKKQPHIRAQPDDQMLISFLRGCKFRMEKTKEKIDMYYTMRTAIPEFYQNRDLRSGHLKECSQVKFFAQLPELDDEGRRVYFIRGGMHNPSVHDKDEMNKLYLMMLDYIMREDDVATIKGLVVIMDMGTLTLGHIAYMTPTYSKKIAVITTEAYPLQPKSQHFINTPSIFSAFYNLIKTLVKEKIRKRLFVHGNLESLYKQVPKRILPNEYGGEAGPIDKLSEDWNKKIHAYIDWYLSEQSFGVDENKRPGKPKTQHDLFGIDGSFRKLDFD